jgi:hypothetical protein
MIHLTEADRALPLAELLETVLKPARTWFIQHYPDNEAEFMAAQDRVLGELRA